MDINRLYGEKPANFLDVCEFYRTEGYSERECFQYAQRVFRGGLVTGVVGSCSPGAAFVGTTAFRSADAGGAGETGTVTVATVGTVRPTAGSEKVNSEFAFPGDHSSAPAVRAAGAG